MGNDHHQIRCPCHKANFNSRSHVGNDQDLFFYRLPSKISIHVPTWGTTKATLAEKATLAISIHVPTWGTTSFALDLIPFQIISIHVPTWGTTCGKLWIIKYLFNFNSRSHVGNDPDTETSKNILGISIHVPTWGTTKQHSMMLNFQAFQFTFPRGERRHE